MLLKLLWLPKLHLMLARDAALASDAAVVSAQADDDAATAAGVAVTTAQQALTDGVASDATSEAVSIAAPTTDANGTREKLALSSMNCSRRSQTLLKMLTSMVSTC